MNITEIVDDSIPICNCTNDDNNNMIEISPLYLLIVTLIPCALSIICCLSFLSCSFIKVLINKK